MPAQALAGETRQVLNAVRPKIRKFCMLSERNTGSNWVAALLKVTLSCLHAQRMLGCMYLPHLGSSDIRRSVNIVDVHIPWQDASAV